MTHPIAGVIRAFGLLDSRVQSSIRKHCEAGNVDAMVQAVADSMLSTAMLQKRIPPNAGIQTVELVLIADAGAREVVDQYRALGGVLLAKGYAEPEALVHGIVQQWSDTWAPRIESVVPQPLDPDRINDVSSVAAQTALRRLSCYIDGDNIVIPSSQVEGLCNRLVNDMLRALLEPNAANHRLIHGDSND